MKKKVILILSIKHSLSLKNKSWSPKNDFSQFSRKIPIFLKKQHSEKKKSSFLIHFFYHFFFFNCAFVPILNNIFQVCHDQKIPDWNQNFPTSITMFGNSEEILGKCETRRSWPILLDDFCCFFITKEPPRMNLGHL